MMSDSGPPVLIGEKVWWLGSGSGLPKRGVVRWIGRLPEIGPDWALGIELEEGLPYGGVDGNWRGRQLFQCKPKHGLIVPSDRVLAHQSASGVVEVPNRKDVSLLPLHNQVSAPPRLRRNNQERSLLLDRHTDFRSVHLEAVQIRRRIQEDQVLSLILGPTSGTSGNVVLSRGMTGDEVTVVPRARRTESLAARKEKTNSRLFSFLRWFRRENKGDRGEERSSFSNPGSPVLRRSDSAITGSIDTLFSTATATSFAYVHPELYHPFGEADEPEKWIFPGPETNTYRNRIKRRDEFRRLNQNISLRKKYNLYASGSLGRSLDDIFDGHPSNSFERLHAVEPIDSCSSTLARKKRKAPPPPVREDSLNSPGCDSLPTTLSKESPDDFKLHRRTVSESAKYKRKAFHVKGKRKAPPPPALPSHVLDDLNNANTLRKKRKAPPPPIELSKENVVNIPKEVALDVIENNKLRIGKIDETETVEDEEAELLSSTDTLRLERGMLKPNKMDKSFVETKIAPTSPVSPRPWYKRPQSSGFSSKQNDWRKKGSKSIEDWMLESGFPRRSQGISCDSKSNIFNKTERPEDKRRSQISILTNISELDREAAEIIQRGKEREKTLLASYNAKYYVDPDENEDGDSSKLIDEGCQTEAVPKKATAKELISLFNSITNISRITVNSNYVAKDGGFLKNGNAPTTADEQLKDKRNSNAESSLMNGVIDKRHLDKDKQIPGPSGVITNGRDKEKDNVLLSRTPSAEENRISRVTIEELDEYDSEKSQSSVITEEKKKKVLPSNGVTITEVADLPMKSPSCSTICSSLLNDSSSSLSSGSSSGAKIKSSQLFSNYPLQKKLSVWICSRCTLENPRWRLTCEACDMWRPTVCDYKLCKKQTSTEQLDDNHNGLKNAGKDIEIKPIPDNVNIRAEKLLDSETTDLIRNGQILASLSSQRVLSKSNDKTSNLQRSPKMIRKEDMREVISNGKRITKENSEVNTNIATTSEDKLFGSFNKQNTEPQQAEVVRKARLAFFIKSDSKNEHDGDFANDSEAINNMDNVSKETATEKLKLRELLREMKNSLPRQRKSQNPDSFLNSISNSANQHDGFEDKPRITKQNSFNERSIVQKSSKPVSENGRSSMLESTRVSDKSNTQSISISNSSVENTKLAEVQNIAITETKQISLNKSINVEDKQQTNNKVVIGANKILTSDAKNLNKAPIIVDTVVKPNAGINEKSDTSRIIVENKTANSIKDISNTQKDINNVKSKAVPEASGQKKAEAIFIKSEIIIEEIKVKNKPEKVSSSAQTSSKVLSLDESSKSDSVNEEVVIPITAEEYLLNDDGSIASSSVRKEPLKIDAKKFELMRPRDFTNIKNNGEFDSASSSTNNFHKDLQTPSTSSSSYSIQELNLPVEPKPGPSTSPDCNSTSIGTLALNRLLKRLEAAITGGQHDVAAGLAKELAKLKVPCSVVRQSPTTSSDILMKVLIEDKTTQKGPISLRVKPWVKLSDLKRKMEKEHDIPVQLQRWFIDKKLASDDQANVRQLGIDGPLTPIFLYYIAQDETVADDHQEPQTKIKTKILNTGAVLEKSEENAINEIGTYTSKASVETATLPSNQSFGWRCNSCSRTNMRENLKCGNCGEIKVEGLLINSAKLNEDRKEKPEVTPLKQTINDPPREEPRPSTSNQATEHERQQNYQKLMDLDKDELVFSVVEFECPVCFIECKPPNGVVLRECLHSFCKACLSKTVEYSEEAEVKCPFRDDTYTCASILLEREIKALVTPEVYEEHLAKSIALAETKIENAFHCKTPDCKGWCIYEDNVNLFKCPVCLHANCLTCQVIHEGLNCKQYQEQLNQDSEINLDAKRTKDMLQEMVDRGEAMPCPRCKVLLLKKWGCDWLRCSMCKTEICWVTRGPRWGPNGKGDTSGGCQCGVNGIKCHPKCNYCH